MNPVLLAVIGWLSALLLFGILGTTLGGCAIPISALTTALSTGAGAITVGKEAMAWHESSVGAKAAEAAVEADKARTARAEEQRTEIRRLIGGYGPNAQ